MKKIYVMLLVLLLPALCLASIAMVYDTHRNRLLFIELQALRNDADALETEWEMLLLEQSTLANDFQVDHIARERLGMVVPAPDSVIYLYR